MVHMMVFCVWNLELAGRPTCLWRRQKSRHARRKFSRRTETANERLLPLLLLLLRPHPPNSPQFHSQSTVPDDDNIAGDDDGAISKDRQGQRGAGQDAQSHMAARRNGLHTYGQARPMPVRRCRLTSPCLAAARSIHMLHR